MKPTISLAAALSAIALTAAACGGATSTPKATTPTTAPSSAAAKAREGATFLKLVAPYNAERAKLDPDKANPTTTAGLQAFLAPLVTASNTLAAALQHAGFTGSAATPALTMAISRGRRRRHPVRDDIELVLRKGGDHPRREDGERRGQCPARDPGPADCDILVPHNRYSSPLLRDDIGERLGEGPLVARRVLGCIAFRRTESPWAPRRCAPRVPGRAGSDPARPPPAP